jgi:hypothetical protein
MPRQRGRRRSRGHAGRRRRRRHARGVLSSAKGDRDRVAAPRRARSPAAALRAEPRHPHATASAATHRPAPQRSSPLIALLTTTLDDSAASTRPLGQRAPKPSRVDPRMLIQPGHDASEAFRGTGELALDLLRSRRRASRSRRTSAASPSPSRRDPARRPAPMPVCSSACSEPHPRTITARYQATAVIDDAHDQPTGMVLGDDV